jgi:hypothetical protein
MITEIFGAGCVDGPLRRASHRVSDVTRRSPPWSVDDGAGTWGPLGRIR